MMKWDSLLLIIFKIDYSLQSIQHFDQQFNWIDLEQQQIYLSQFFYVPYAPEIKTYYPGPVKTPEHPFSYKNTTFSNLRTILGNNQFNCFLDKRDNEAEANFSGKKIPFIENKSEFSNKLKNILDRRRNNLIDYNFSIRSEKIVELITNSFENDLNQGALFFIFYNFVSTAFCTKNIKFQVTEDCIVLERIHGFKLTNNLISLDIAEWKKLDFKFDTVYEAYRILRELGGKIALSSRVSKGFNYIDYYRDRIFEDLELLWG